MGIGKRWWGRQAWLGLMAGWLGLFSGWAEGPASGPASAKAPWCLLTELQAFRARLLAVDFAQQPAATFLRPYLEVVYRSNPDSFAEVGEQAGELVEVLFATRLLLRDKLKALHEGGGRLDDDSLAAMRDAFRAGRYLEDFLAAEYLRAPGHGVLAGEAPSLLVNPSHRRGPGWSVADLRSGDLLLSRGNAVTSAAIARLSLPPAQFSHLAMVYQHPGNRRFYTVEAHLEVGSEVAPLDKYCQDGKLRAVVFRHQDAVLARRAADHMYHRVKGASAGRGNIPYDFALDASTPEQLFCSELAYWAFKVASQGEVELPLYPSELNSRLTGFHRSIGIEVESAFLPADLEVDTRFELVCEWRDLENIRAAHRRDAVLSGIYLWMADRDYRFRDSRRSRLFSHTVYPLRRVPGLGGWLLGSRFPPYMGREVFRTILTLEEVAEAIEEELERRQEQVLAARGVGLTMPEAMSELERLRRQDYTAFAAGGKSLFHRHFHP